MDKLFDIPSPLGSVVWHLLHAQEPTTANLRCERTCSRWYPASIAPSFSRVGQPVVVPAASVPVHSKGIALRQNDLEVHADIHVQKTRQQAVGRLPSRRSLHRSVRLGVQRAAGCRKLSLLDRFAHRLLRTPPSHGLQAGADCQQRRNRS